MDGAGSSDHRSQKYATGCAPSACAPFVTFGSLHQVYCNLDTTTRFVFIAQCPRLCEHGGGIRL